MILLLLACSTSPSTTAAKIDSAPVDTADTTSDSAGESDSMPPPFGSCDDQSFNPWYGTCVDTFFEPCFVPSGQCDTVPGDGSSTTTWPNGAVLAMVLGAGMPPPVTMTLTSPDGIVCATGASVESAGCAAADQKMGLVFTRVSDGATEAWCLALDGSSVEVTCADGSEQTSPPGTPGAVACMFGGDLSCDPFGGPPPE